MKYLIIILSVLAIAGAAWAGEITVYDCPDFGTCFKVDDDHPPLHKRVKEKSCRWEINQIVQSSTNLSLQTEAHIHISLEPIGVTREGNIRIFWFKRKVCE